MPIEQEKNFSPEDVEKVKEIISQNPDLDLPDKTKESIKKALHNLSAATDDKSDDSSLVDEDNSQEKFLPSYLSESDPAVKAKVEYLIDVAISKGISKSISQAKKEPPFVLDAFHDALADRLIPTLVKKGIIKQ